MIDPNSSMQRKFILAVSAVLLAITVCYSNYFFTGLHIDDYSSIRDNPAIRSLRNVPRFFFDPSTSSTDPADYAYRPVVTTSLAVDYFLGRGLSPFFLHFSTFLVFLAGLALIGWFFWLVFEQTLPHPWNAYLAILAAALFGLHPAVAELLNSLSQRGEMFAALGVVGGVALYAAFPGRRRFGLYLLPPLVGVLANPAGLIFGPMLLAYILLIEPPPTYDKDQAFTPDQTKSRDQTQAPIETEPSGDAPERIRIRRRKHPFRRYLKAQLARFTPALLFTAAAGVMHSLSIPSQVSSESLVSYWFTQPWAAWHYFAGFFAPFHLGPASDLAVFTSYDIHAVLGLIFLIGMISVALLLAVSRVWRPVVFGIWWFIIGLLPGAMLIQADVESDTRMFLPLIGLVLAVAWTFRMLLPSGEPLRRLEAIVAAAIILALGFGTYARNRVWSDELGLWYDAIEKHPKSVHGLLNYGLALAAKGQASEGFEYLRQARHINPDSAEVEANMGTVAGLLNRNGEAEDHFRVGLQLGADRPLSHFLAAAWLEKQGRYADALESYSWASSLAPTDLRPRYGMMRCYAALLNWNDLRKAVDEAQQMWPGEPGLVSFAAAVRNHPDSVKAAEQLVKERPTPENYGTLSENYCLVGEYTKCLEAAKKAIEIQPRYAAGYNYLGAAYMSLGRLDEAIDSVKKALDLDPENKAAFLNLTQWERLKLEAGNSIVRQ